MQSISNHKGFSFYELMAAIAIIAITSSIAIPNLIASRAETKLRGAVNNLKGDLNIAKMVAVKENVPVVVQFYSDHYEMYLDNDADWKLGAGERCIRNRRLPAGVSIDLTNTEFNGNDCTRFNERGVPDKTVSVAVVGSSGDQQVIDLNRLGRVCIQ